MDFSEIGSRKKQKVCLKFNQKNRGKTILQNVHPNRTRKPKAEQEGGGQNCNCKPKLKQNFTENIFPNFKSVQVFAR